MQKLLSLVSIKVHPPSIWILLRDRAGMLKPVPGRLLSSRAYLQPLIKYTCQAIRFWFTRHLGHVHTNIAVFSTRFGFLQSLFTQKHTKTFWKLQSWEDFSKFWIHCGRVAAMAGVFALRHLNVHCFLRSNCPKWQGSHQGPYYTGPILYMNFHFIYDN